MSFKENVKKHFKSGAWEILEKFDEGTKGSNEVAHVQLENGIQVVHKVMLGIEQYFHIPKDFVDEKDLVVALQEVEQLLEALRASSTWLQDFITNNVSKGAEDVQEQVVRAIQVATNAPPSWTKQKIKPPLSKVAGRQKRKAMAEATFALLDKGIGGDIVTPRLYVQLWEPFHSYHGYWGDVNAESHRRICEVVREYAPKWSGEEWRGIIYAKDTAAGLDNVDAIIKAKMETSLDAQRISVLDMITINQDRSARNWTTDGERFYAIDNGMAWFHEYPESDGWKQGCVIDDVILQKKPWQFIAGVFSTLWEGKDLSEKLYEGMKNLDQDWFLDEVGKAAVALGFPRELKDDWRFFAILKRLDWMVEHRRLPRATEYRSWLSAGSEFFTPPEVVESGGKVVWLPSWDKE